MGPTLRQLVCLLLCVTISGMESARIRTHRNDDDIDTGVRTGDMLKMLREMVSQANATAANTLNLPANASSIRENITDTFSCENRTYGYYADVDNDCQIFHVCLPSQTASGRNVTYKWSFICPNETIFNQEVLVCTRPEDAIDCADSPMYYDKNDEFGKVNNTMTDPSNSTTEATRKKPNYIINNNVINKRKDVKRKQNIVMAENMMMGDDTEEMMVDGMMMDKENDMMIDVNNDNMQKNEVKRKQNVAMADSVKEMIMNGMMMDGVKEMMADGSMTDGMKEMMTDMMMNANNMADGMIKKPTVTMTNALKKPSIDVTKTQNGHVSNGIKQQISGVNKKEAAHRKPMADKMKKEKDLVKDENSKKQMTVTHIEMTENSGTQPAIAEDEGDFGTYYHGDMIEGPMEVMNDSTTVEKGFKNNGKRLKKRGAFRFKADI